MSKLTGQLLSIAQRHTLEALTSVEVVNDSRFDFWSSEDSKHQQERKLAKATVINETFELWRLDHALKNPYCKLVGVDVESTGFNYWEHEILGIGFACFNAENVEVWDEIENSPCVESDRHFELYYVNLSHYPGENQELIYQLSLILHKHNESIRWVLHNAKFDQHWIKSRLGFYLKAIDDSMVMAYVLGLPNKAIDKLAPIYLSRFPHTLSSYLGKSKITPEDMLSIPVEWLADYCVEDCLEGVLLSIKFELMLKDASSSHQQYGFFNLYHVYEQIDLFCIHALNWAEETGVLIDWDRLSSVGDSMSAELFGIECEISELLGTTLEEAHNLCQSPAVLSHYLYSYLGLPTNNIKATKFGYSTAVEALKELKDHHRLPQIVLEHRKLSKVNGTYIKGFHERRRGERLYTTFNNCLTDTGRLSSSNPNLHNIPNPALSPTGKLLRQCFVAGEGNVLVKADYSQFELRILAHLSQDPYLLDAYRTEVDVHSVVACLLFDIPFEQFDPDNNPLHKMYRRLAKTINFGFIYGMTAHRLLIESRKAGLDYTLVQCEEIMAKYWVKFPGVESWMAMVKLKAVRDGYTETLFGRRRYFEFHNPYLRSLRGKAKGMYLTLSNWKILEAKGVLNHPKDSEAFRACGNAPIQGTNADAIRMVMGMLYGEYYGTNVKLLLNVHDEVVLECPWEIQEDVSRKLVEVMTSIIKLSVPVVVEPSVATSWGDT